MDIHQYIIEAQEERVLFECKGRFQRNYPQYIAYILYSKHIPRKVIKMYRRMPLTHAVQRISQFFNHLNEQRKEDELQDDCLCLSLQPLTVADKRTSLNIFNENEHVNRCLSDHFHETVEVENDIINIDDLSNESKCSITVLDSGIFPRYNTTAHLSTDVFSQFASQPIGESHQFNELSNNPIRQKSILLTKPSVLMSGSPSFDDRRVPPTPPVNQSDNLSISPVSYHPTYKQRCRTRLYRYRTVRRSRCSLQEAPSTINQRQIQRYLCKFKRLTHHVNRLYKKINRITECQSSIYESDG